MTAYAFRILNVFTVGADRLSGNPLCVFEDGRGLTDAQMQGLARQMNLSETTFVLPTTNGDATARVRIFTPGFEMPFAGHPTLGTAHVVRSLRGGDEQRLEMKAGVVSVAARGDTWTLRTAREPAVREPTASRADFARMLGLGDSAVSGPPLWVSTGVEQLVIPLGGPALVRAARPDPSLLVRWGYSEARDEAMAYVWAHDPDTGPDMIVVRFFFTSHGAVVEDPATGSACANLGGYFIATGAALPIERTLRQGEATGRPSRLGLSVGADRSIRVTGAVIELGRGTVDL
jgi:trans-2,3-dihydro-3-hydroxyanthranilate isomerase